MRRLGALALALALAGCGGEPSSPDGCACNPDFAQHDLAQPADLATPPDLAETPDLAPPPDLVQLPDIARGDAPAHCQPNAGYAGMNQCGEEGTCDGHKFTLDCDGNVCHCAIDGVETKSFPQTNECNGGIMGAWTNGCGF